MRNLKKLDNLHTLFDSNSGPEADDVELGVIKNSSIGFIEN